MNHGDTERTRALTFRGDFPSPPFRGEREGPSAKRWEGEVGVGKGSGIPHLTPSLSAPEGGEGGYGSGCRVVHEALRRRFAPWAADLAAAPQIGGNAGVQDVGVGPVLMHSAPRVAPIIEHLAAERMAADAPEVFVALLLQVLVADHDVVHIGRFVRQVVETRLVAADAEEDMVVDIIIAAVEPVERADQIFLLIGIHFVGAAEAERLAIPAERLFELRGMHDEMADALDVARAAFDAVEGVAAAGLVFADVDRRAH